MTDDIKTYLDQMDWPTPEARIKARVMANISMAPAPARQLLFRPALHLALALCLLGCLMAGMAAGPLADGAQVSAANTYVWGGAGATFVSLLAS